MRAHRSLEIIYLSLFEMQTAEGKIYFYGALDDYSHYIFNLGFYSSFEDATLIQAIENLLNDEVFQNGNTGFTLVSSIGEHLKPQLDQRLTQVNGQIIFDPKRVKDYALPTFEAAMKNSGKRVKPIAPKLVILGEVANWLNPEFIDTINPHPSLSSQARNLLTHFKDTFRRGIDYFSCLDDSVIDYTSTINDDEYVSYLIKYSLIHDHSGIFYWKMPGQKDYTSCVFNVKRNGEALEVVAFTIAGARTMLAVGELNSDGISVYSPSGQNDLSRICFLISFVTFGPVQRNYNPDSFGINNSGGRLISVSKHEYIVLK